MIKNMELAQVRRGESFILDGVKFVKLDEDAHASFVLTADVFPKHIPFEHKDAERKAMNMEIQRQLVEYDRKNELELDAIILWELHTQLGLGPKRLKKFFDGFSDALNALVNRYEMDISDDVWLCTHKLKEIGVDVEDWYRQKE